MDKKQFEQAVRGLAECCQHVDGDHARRRKHLLQSAGQPLVLVKLLPLPHDCEDCGKSLSDRKVRSHTRKPQGWRSHCTGCNRTRQPGSEVFGQTTGVKASERGVKISLDAESVSEPMMPLLSDHQLEPIEIVPNEPVEPQFVEQVIVREYHGSVIREFVRIPIDPLLDSDDVPEPDNAVHKD